MIVTHNYMSIMHHKHLIGVIYSWYDSTLLKISTAFHMLICCDFTQSKQWPVIVSRTSL